MYLKLLLIFILFNAMVLSATKGEALRNHTKHISLIEKQPTVFYTHKQINIFVFGFRLLILHIQLYLCASTNSIDFKMGAFLKTLYFVGP